jgi:hypothetical protein
VKTGIDLDCCSEVVLKGGILLSSSSFFLLSLSMLVIVSQVVFEVMLVEVVNEVEVEVEADGVILPIIVVSGVLISLRSRG